MGGDDAAEKKDDKKGKDKDKDKDDKDKEKGKDKDKDKDTEAAAEGDAAAAFVETAAGDIKEHVHGSHKIHHKGHDHKGHDHKGHDHKGATHTFSVPSMGHAKQEHDVDKLQAR